MMSKTLTGLCVGGPRDGQSMAAYMKREMLFKATLYPLDTGIPDDAPPSVILGTYTHDGDKTWTWEAYEAA